MVKFIILACLACAAPSLAEAMDDWKVGFARSKITPTAPVMMAGYAERDRPSEGVANDLYVKAMSLEDTSGKRAILITSDLIGFRAEIAEALVERIMAESGLSRSDILLNCSHTHAGPTLATAGALRQLDEPFVEPLEDYTEWLQDQVVETALRSLEATQPAQLGHAIGSIDFVMNRREPTEKGIRLGVNPSGPVDRSVPVLRVEALDGSLIGVVFGAACHNTTLTGSFYEICGDFAGFAQEHVEVAYPGAQAMFMQGCGGDADPFPRGTLTHSKRHGESLATEVRRLLEGGDFRQIRGPLQTRYARVPLPLESPPSAKEIEAMKRSSAGWERNAAEALAREQADGTLATHYVAPFALWQFGTDLSLVALPGEAVYDYVLATERGLGPLHLWISAYNNDVFGYLPSARILREGGYETRGLYSGRRFAPEVEVVVEEALKRLAVSAGRDVTGPK